ncbi:MAG: alpha/beta hydrolase [Acholeplasmataceae bacterium]|nr:alpha/beta hydrolase [Acholeplasmataceae bacterium]
MIHIIRNKKAKHTLVLLHGTGGDESDLIPIGTMIDPDANMLSIRGSVNEHGMNRFFRRIAPGVFDEYNLIEETHKLHDFIIDVVCHEDLDPEGLIVIGYSNGANIAVSLMMFYPDLFKAAILLRPMIPLERMPIKHQKTQAFVSSGTRDQVVPRGQSDALVTLLEHGNIKVTHLQNETGHQLIQSEINAIRLWVHQINE